jgi:hypothetical protein
MSPCGWRSRTSQHGDTRKTHRCLFTRRPIGFIRAHARAYLVINAGAYGLFLVGFGVGILSPHLSRAQHTRLVGDGTADLVRSLFANPWLFALTTFAANTVKMAALTIVGPSMIVPYAGLALFAYWAYTTGVTLVPASDIGWVALIPHSVTLLIEFQAYTSP